MIVRLLMLDPLVNLFVFLADRLKNGFASIEEGIEVAFPSTFDELPVRVLANGFGCKPMCQFMLMRSVVKNRLEGVTEDVVLGCGESDYGS